MHGKKESAYYKNLQPHVQILDSTHPIWHVINVT